MRALASVAVVVLGLALLPACAGSDECGDGAEVIPEGEVAAGQASCAWSLSIDGVQYFPDCAPVPHSALGDVLVQGTSAGIHVVARTIAGVPQEQAIALFTGVPKGPDRRRDERRCGRWSVASSTDLDPQTARSIERSVAAGATI